MYKKMDFIDYRERLGIGFDDKEKEELFFTHVYNALGFFDNSTYSYNQISESEYWKFCRMVGWSIEKRMYGSYWDSIMKILEANDNSLKEFLSYYIFFVICQEETEYKAVGKKYFIDLLCIALEESHIPYEIMQDNNEYFIFPKGAKELDDALVSAPLEWLKDYPGAHKTYCIALQQYAEGKYVRDTADNLRKALETFLQEFLGNDKNLENNKNEICRYLGNQGVDAGISGLFKPLIDAYKNINDRIAKHNDLVDERLLEFLLYQTGVLIRMVIIIKKTETVG